MSWEKIEDHLFEEYCVEGEDKKLCILMKEHDTEIRANALDEFISRLEKYQRDNWVVTLNKGITWSDIKKIAEQVKEGAE